MIDAEKNTLLHMRKNIILTAFAIKRKGGGYAKKKIQKLTVEAICHFIRGFCDNRSS